MIKEANLYNGEKTFSSTSGVWKAGQLHVNQWNWKTPSHHTWKKKTNLSKWVRGLNIRPERIENIAEHFAYKS